MNTNSILNRKNGKRPKGFTLIELLVVVIIIGILAAIAVPIFLNQRRAAWKASAESDASNATLAIETARTQGGTLDGVQFGGGNGGAPMTITVGSETTKATVSPGNTEEAWVSKDASGAECYAVMTTNKNLDGWAAVRTSEGGMTTGTPPANGSVDCPRPAPASSAFSATITLGSFFDGSHEMTPVALALTIDGSTVSVRIDAAPGTITGAARAAVSQDGSSPLAVTTLAGAPVSAGGEEFSMDWGTPNPLILGLRNGATVSIDIAAQTATYTPAS